MAKQSLKREFILIGISLIVSIILLFIGPISQDGSYHNFVDKRRMFGVPNFHDVISNLPFFLVGIWGMLKYKGSTIPEFLRLPFLIFCIGLAFTSFGSSYYHLDPNNSTLLWDRLPMTVVFMSVFCALVSDYISREAGRRMLIPALIFGLASVIYWHFTEKFSIGDLRPYVIVQYLPALLIPLILWMYDPASSQRRPIVMAFIFYGLAKLFEVLDVTVFELNAGIISGHTIKHVFAAVGTYYVAKMFLEAKRM